MTTTLSSHPKLPAAMIDQHKAPELVISTESGNAGCAKALSEDREAVGIVKEIMRFLGVREARWKAVEWAGQPGTPNTRIDVQMRDLKMRVRVGRYIGILLNCVHNDGHSIDQRELYSRWSLEEFRQRTSRSKPAPAPVSQPSVDTDEGTFSQNPERVLKLLKLCHAKLDANEAIHRDQIFDALRAVGGVENTPIRMGGVIYRLTQRGLFVVLDDERKLYGLEDKALTMIGALPAPSPAPAAPAPGQAAPEPVAALPANPAPASELAGLLQGAEAKMAQVRALESDLGKLRAQISENEARQRELKEENDRLAATVRLISAEAEKLADVRSAVEYLRRAIGA